MIRFFAVVKPDGTSLFGKAVNGYKYSQVFNDVADAESALEKFKKRSTSREVYRVVEVKGA